MPDLRERGATKASANIAGVAFASFSQGQIFSASMLASETPGSLTVSYEKDPRKHLAHVTSPPKIPVYYKLNRIGHE
jgi:hypothetical protein